MSVLWSNDRNNSLSQQTIHLWAKIPPDIWRPEAVVILDCNAMNCLYYTLLCSIPSLMPTPLLRKTDPFSIIHISLLYILNQSYKFISDFFKKNSVIELKCEGCEKQFNRPQDVYQQFHSDMFCGQSALIIVCHRIFFNRLGASVFLRYLTDPVQPGLFYKHPCY